MTTRRQGWIVLYQWAAGLCDASTGAFLIAAPAWTFGLMGLRILPALAFVRFVGVFVGCVGLSYLWVAARCPMREWQGQWTTTALIRSGVAIFLIWQIAAGAMERGWIAVAMTDALLAVVQWIGLSRSWLRHANER